ncbi:MAG: Ig-like domain-containing protein, partial [Clostridia bacterium]|nr:Ig-like domain-containing protein [Clostridia bacterium]
MRSVKILILSIILTVILAAVSAGASASVLPKSIIVKSYYITLTPGQEISLKAVVLPKKAKDKSLNYTSANERIVVARDTGVLRGVEVGTTAVTLTSKANPKVKTTVQVH